MFTGIIQWQGTVSDTRRGFLGVQVPLKKPLKKGDSVAVNGVCLTVSRQKAKPVILGFDLSAETLEKTTLGRLQKGVPVNIEPALTAQDALGGHLVQGHVDDIGRVIRITGRPGGKTVWFEAPRHVAHYLVKKGSIAVDGVSLTVADVKGNRFAVALIPFTLRHTNLSLLRVGQRVNLEADVIAKYVHSYLKRT